MNELKNKMTEIKRQKDTYIIPGNLRKDVTVFGVTGTYEGSGGVQQYSQLGDNSIPTSIIRNSDGRIYNLFATHITVYTANHNIAVVSLNDVIYYTDSGTLRIGLAIESTGSRTDFDAVGVNVGVVWQSGVGGGQYNDFRILLNEGTRDGMGPEYLVEVPMKSNWYQAVTISIANQYISSSTDSFSISLNPVEDGIWDTWGEEF